MGVRKILFMRPATSEQRVSLRAQRSNLCDQGQHRLLRRLRLLAMTLLIPSFYSLVSSLAFASETIVAHETDRYFYKDGKVLRYEGQFEYTYFLDLEKDILTRTRVFDFINKKITPDETVYHIEKQLLSHPTNAEHYVLTPVIRAVGQTSADSVEILTIEQGFVNVVSSTSNEIVVSRAKQLK